VLSRTSTYSRTATEDPRVLLSSDSITTKVSKKLLPRMVLKSVAEPSLSKLLLPEKRDPKEIENKEDLKATAPTVSLSET